MAITASNLTSNLDATDVESFNTASISPGANRLILVAVAIRTYTAGGAGTISLSGNGLTYVQITSVDFSNVASARGRLAVFRAMGASPSAGAITITISGNDNNAIAWSVDEFDGVDTSGTNGSGAIVQSPSTSTDDAEPAPTITLSALGDASNNAVYTCWSNAQNRNLTPTTDYTELADQAGNNCCIETHYKVPGTTSIAPTGFVNFDDAAGIAIEIKAAAAGGSDLTHIYNNNAFLLL